MLAVDILEVSVSRNNHHYLLFVMDYFTKWADAIPLHDQKATTIADAVIKLCSVPDVLHSDQGRNFESSLFHQVLQAFGIHKTRTTAYHPQSDGMVERFNRSLLQLLPVMLKLKRTGNVSYHWYFMPIALFNTHQLVFYHFN